MSGSSTPILPVPRRLSVLSRCITEKSVVKDLAETEGITPPWAAADRGAGAGCSRLSRRPPGPGQTARGRGQDQGGRRSETSRCALMW